MNVFVLDWQRISYLEKGGLLGLVFPRQGAKLWLPWFARGHHHAHGGPHGQAVTTWPFKLCSGFWAVATTGYLW